MGIMKASSVVDIETISPPLRIEHGMSTGDKYHDIAFLVGEKDRLDSYAVKVKFFLARDEGSILAGCLRELADAIDSLAPYEWERGE